MRFTILFVLIFIIFTQGQAVKGLPIVSEARIGEAGISTRLVLVLSERVEYKLYVLEDPYRLVIDFPTIVWGLDRKFISLNVNSVQGIRFANFKDGISRVVLDLRGPVEITNSYFLEPDNTPYFRFVLDFDRLTDKSSKSPLGQRINSTITNNKINQKSSIGTFESSAEYLNLANRLPKPIAKPALGRVSKKKIAVVIDAGHGGKDPGAVIGRNRYFEKDIAFAAAKTLKVILEKLGYKAILSRNGDYYISLSERVRIAQINNADLFVSLHADKHPDQDVSGIAVYTLSSKASDAESEALAKRENDADIIFKSQLSESYDQELRQILISLFQRTTMTCSVQMAGQAVKQLSESHRLLRRPHRFAGFRVLKSPKIPSVLIEMGYLSNSVDRKILLSKRGRYAIMLQVGRAIDAYFESNETCLISS